MKVSSLNGRQRISIGQITHAVYYLIRNRYKGYSPSAVSRYLKKNYDYITYTNKMGMHCEFDAEDIWQNYFLQNPIFIDTLKTWNINTIDDLIHRSCFWK